jgi:SAM-dependent methyltransferase
MSYNQFAYFYDSLMQDVPYDLWEKYILNEAEKYGVHGKKLLDIGCGTGAISIPLAKKGFSVTGVDLSVDMLAVANEKAIQENCTIQFVHSDMRELENLGMFQIIGIFCDSLNYLLSEDEIIQTLSNAYNHIEEGGIILFDVHSLHKINGILKDYSYSSNGEELSLIWNCFEGEKENSIEHELTFFSLTNDSHTYERFDELHVQRTFPIELYKQWLEKVGFKNISVTADFSEEAPNDKSERIFFAAQK